tara:strand:- start:415 stop:1065 length:651 start_codon:yes stop_codon:yes gene_type:complete
LNPLYEYLIYFGIGAIVFVFILIQLTKSFLPKNNIRISRGLSSASENQDNVDDHGTEEINEIRAPTQSEFNLEDPNEIKFLSLHLASKKDSSLKLSLLQTKVSAYGLEFSDGSFIKRGSEKLIKYFVFNGEEGEEVGSGAFSDKENINMISIVLPQNGQKNILRSFEEMLSLARNLSSSFDMRLLDEHFNGMSEQTITDYKERATNLDHKLSSYGS